MHCALHMVLCLKCCAVAGLAFTGVHDSFWTHACDADPLGVQLREAFVELHSQPLLEQLHEQLTTQYPQISIPELPELSLGTLENQEHLEEQLGVAPPQRLDLNQVLEAPYFFN